MSEKKKPNWIKIRNEYETTNTSYAKLAKKYKVSVNTLRPRAVREGWTNSKEETCIEIASKTHQKAVTKISQRNNEHLQIWDLIQSKVKEVVTKELNQVVLPFTGETVETNLIQQDKLETASRIMERIQKGHRLGEGTLDEKDKRKLDIELQKLEIEKQKLLLEQSRKNPQEDDENGNGIVILAERVEEPEGEDNE